MNTDQKTHSFKPALQHLCPEIQKKMKLKNIHNYLRRLLNPSSPSLTTYLREARFSSYVLTKAKHCNRLNAEAEKSSRLSSIKPDIEETLKTYNNAALLTKFLQNRFIFPKNVICVDI